jgi:5-methylcytosine-specific restriction endonuclease McrA
MCCCWFKLPPDKPDSPFNIQLNKFYSSLKITKEEAALIPPDIDEIKEGYDTDLVSEGILPYYLTEETRGRPSSSSLSRNKNSQETTTRVKKRVPITIRSRQEVYTRCRNICEYCDVYYPDLQIHHKDGNPTNNEQDNLMGVCYSCHKKLDKMLIVTGKKGRPI